MNIVLASGFLFPQQLGPVEYFRGVKEHLEDAGHKVIAPPVPPRASCLTRATQSASAIQAKFGNEPVHLIGHSMGGLDCRMMIGNNLSGMGDDGRVLSLTTISTPHQGSPVADLVLGKDDQALGSTIAAALQSIGIDTEALNDLTVKAAAEKRIPDILASHPKIKYLSYGAMGRPNTPPTAGLLVLSYAFLKGMGMDNDGAVPVDSMKYGEFQEPFWPCDHLQEMGYDLDTILVPSMFDKQVDQIKAFLARTLGLGSPRFDHMAKFDEIVAKLQAL